MLIKTPASHKNDPQSSFNFEEYINKSGQRKRNQDVVYNDLLIHPESTAQEIAERINFDVVEVRRRLSDMKGVLVERRSELRLCHVAGKRVSVWYVK